MWKSDSIFPYLQISTLFNYLNEFWNLFLGKDYLKNEWWQFLNEGKSVAAERFIRTLKNKINKHMTAISKKKYIDKLNDIVNKYNTYHIVRACFFKKDLICLASASYGLQPKTLFLTHWLWDNHHF